eukprot:TRINITY_DN20871_c0_g1_i2.p1 TRINITY_DN20871_c0_g1~~TRINITY_DN20871_c0_g1_i2.p1  ORF type:complete len:619 (-),score=221.60 TRINITY_DN20871_c0_g1_i2:67-1923(-)
MQLGSYLKSEERKLYNLVDLVSKLLKNEVLDKFNGLISGLQSVKDVSDELDAMSTLCKNTRRFIHQSEEQLTGAGKRILSNVQQKRQYIAQQQLLIQVQQIWSRQQSLKEALDEGDFPRAVLEHGEIDSILEEHEEGLKGLVCFEGVLGDNGSIKRLKLDLKLAVDLAAQQVCSYWCPKKYGYLLGVYQTSLFDEADFSAKMRHSFHQAVKHVSKEAVKAYVLLDTTDEGLQDNLKAMKFRELCQHIQAKYYTQCVKAVFERFWDVMYSHWAMLQHHTQFESSEFVTRVNTALLELRHSVWDQIKRRVEHLLNFHLASCKVEDMLIVIEHTKQLMDVGEMYSDSDSTILRGSIANKTSQYFKSFHQSNADQLAVVLDNESWMPIPVKPDFSVKSIKELQVGFSLARPLVHDGAEADKEWAAAGNPFSGPDLHAQAQAQAAEEDDEADAAALLGEIDEDAAPGEQRSSTSRRRAQSKGDGTSSSGLVLTNASMVLIRSVARYIMIMDKLDLGSEALTGLVLLCDLYVYNVFAVAYMKGSELSMSPSLTRMLTVMRNNLRKSPYYASRFPPPPPEPSTEKKSMFSNLIHKADDTKPVEDWPCPSTVMLSLIHISEPTRPY